MSNESALEAMEREKARLLEEAAAIERDIAEFKRITAKYNFVVDAATGNAEPRPRKNEGQPTDVSVAGLVHRYRTDERSRYQKLRFKTRSNYDIRIRRVLEDCGDDKLAELKAGRILKLYEGWSDSGNKP